MVLTLDMSENQKMSLIKCFEPTFICIISFIIIKQFHCLLFQTFLFSFVH